MNRSVVITGIGTVSGLGVGSGPLWEGLLAGTSALRRFSGFDPTGFVSRVGAQAIAFPGAKDFVPKSYRKAVKVMARDTELAVAAAKLAVEDASLITRGSLPEGVEGATHKTTYPPSRVGCHIGAGLIAAETDELTLALATARTGEASLPALDLKAWGTQQGGTGAMNNLPPLWMLKYLPNMLACHVTIIHGAEGPSNTITCAEASGLLSIGESARVIERGDADLCFSGGAESKINFMGIMRQQLGGRLAPTADAATGESFVRPFDPESPGSLLGEGAGILIVEAASEAAARGARPYAEIVGFGASHSDAMSVLEGTATPDWSRGDDGIRFAVENALNDAGLGAEAIDAIIPYACGVPRSDAAELGALSAVFGPRLPTIPLITLAPFIGETQAANGGLAAAVGALCLRHQKLPARIHAGKPHPDAQAGRAPGRDASLRHILVMNSSLGGQNAALILRAPAPG
jgi:3-oxoacyl-[acyl-carrier-protein] synthase II